MKMPFQKKVQNKKVHGFISVFLSQELTLGLNGSDQCRFSIKENKSPWVNMSCFSRTMDSHSFWAGDANLTCV